MSELHKFLFDGLPVRGMVVRLSDAWVQILQRRAANNDTGAYPQPVRDLLGEMTAAAVLMQANIKFNGALVLQIFGDGPVKLAVVEVQPDLSVRATATVVGEVAAGASLSEMVNVINLGRCAITLDPRDRFPGQQPYQGVVPLFGDRKEKLEKFSEVLEHYMLQSEQLDTTLVLAANGEVAAGLLIQRLPNNGGQNTGGQIPISSASSEAKTAAQRAAMNLESAPSYSNEDEIGRNQDYQRIALLASTLKPEELLTLDVDTLLHRLCWEEKLLRFEALSGASAPRFACRCNRERVSQMIRSLGVEEVESILTEREDVEVGCDFCGQQYRFDAVDAAQIFKPDAGTVPGSSLLH
ncbi:MAG: Hsp33 family molecular chaperone HslO [Betaproteobacteria bacterium]